jgi:hypothetical protein
MVSRAVRTTTTGNSNCRRPAKVIVAHHQRTPRRAVPGAGLPCALSRSSRHSHTTPHEPRLLLPQILSSAQRAACSSRTALPGVAISGVHGVACHLALRSAWTTGPSPQPSQALPACRVHSLAPARWDRIPRVSSGSVQRGSRAEATAEAGLSVIRPRGDRSARVTSVRPDDGKIL